MRPIIQHWAGLLSDTAAPVVREALDRSGSADALVTGFCDESGHRRAVDPFLIAAALASSQSTDACVGGGGAGSKSAEVELWRMAGMDSPSPDSFLSDRDGPGPLLNHADRSAIEVLTEADLCAMHALWSIARKTRRADLANRCLAAAAWHAAELQPDNATQSPWAIHVFVVLAAATGAAEALGEAGVRLHNCLLGRGQPDLRSALILHHAAAELDTLARESESGTHWFQTV